MAYNLFLDDLRVPANIGDIRTWTIVRNYNDFVKVITERGLPDLISFDHDLAAVHYSDLKRILSEDRIDYDTYKEKTGYHCAVWLTEYCLNNDKPLPKWQVHSLNPVGKKNIEKLLNMFDIIHNEPESIQNEIT